MSALPPGQRGVRMRGPTQGPWRMANRSTLHRESSLWSVPVRPHPQLTMFPCMSRSGWCTVPPAVYDTVKPGHCDFFCPQISRKKKMAGTVLSNAVRDKEQWRFRDRRCRSLGGLRRPRGGTPGAGALQAGRHGASAHCPARRQFVSFFFTHLALRSEHSGAFALERTALRNRPPPRRTA